ncbi:NitT/TauT family transport system permease protein OS=Castellaniella defragrans OX=75697 GN=HNR28_000322 PE=3 SV=1 [Castellaniella defragrans]
MTHRMQVHLLEAAVPIVALTLWWLVSNNSSNVFFPPLPEILTAFKDNWLFARVGSDVVPSLARLGAGFGIAVVLGIGGGLILGLIPTIQRATSPIMEFMRAIPAPAMIPFGIIVLGVGDSMKIAIIALVCLWPILLTTIDGVYAVEPLVLDTATIYRTSAADRLIRVILPSASPQIFGGLRTSISLALVVMVISEMMASTNGIGYFVLQSQRTFNLADMWSGVILLGILGYALNALLFLVEFFALRWHRGAHRNTE